MIIKTFIGLDKGKATKRVLDYWYRNFLNTLTLKEFLSKCTWRREGSEIVIIYRGSAPKIKK